jgi:hypothetical protein
VTLTHHAAAEASSSRIPPGPEAFDRKVWIRRGTAGSGRMFLDANRAIPNNSIAWRIYCQAMLP